ncbi:hypothetical protein DFJ74DRAFT_10935 [Hyaloraphidium curvatum]|nr:hypothetical protein DFJ74DRAFT_10935 [Hyaloraphidium curvatum]
MPGVLSTLGAGVALLAGSAIYVSVVGIHLVEDNLGTFVRKNRTTGLKEVTENYSQQLSRVLGSDPAQTLTYTDALFKSYLRAWTPFVSHNVLAVPWLLFPLQFVGPLRRAYPGFHRLVGNLLVYTIVPCAVTGAWLGIHSTHGLLAAAPGCAIAAGSLFYSISGYLAIRRRDVATHQLRMTQLAIFLMSIPLSRLSVVATWPLSGKLPENEEAPVWRLMDQNVPTGLWVGLGAGHFMADWYGRTWDAGKAESAGVPQAAATVAEAKGAVVPAADEPPELASRSSAKAEAGVVERSDASAPADPAVEAVKPASDAPALEPKNGDADRAPPNSAAAIAEPKPV